MIILDIREKDEFEAERIPGSVFCPMSQFDILAPGLFANLKNDEVVLMCRSGNRAGLVFERLQKQTPGHMKFSVYEGGIQRWKKEGKPVETKRTRIPIMRQVLILASSLIFLSFALSALVASDFIYLSLVVGGGLALAGWTGFCPSARVLQWFQGNS